MYYLTNTETGTTMEARETIPGVSQAVPDALVKGVFSLLTSGYACRIVGTTLEGSPDATPGDGARYDWDTAKWVIPN